MFRSTSRWLTSKPFAHQLVILAFALDPIGFGAGYLLAPSLDVEPLMGGAFGLIVANIPTAMLVMRHASNQG